MARNFHADLAYALKMAEQEQRLAELAYAKQYLAEGWVHQRQAESWRSVAQDYRRQIASLA
jgi:hypothetical protein